MKKLFGTDGIRAVAGEYPLDKKTIFTLANVLVELLQQEGLKTRVLIGRDTRESGSWIEEILFQGIQAGGGEAVSSGVIPTSAVSFLTRKHSFSAGIVISASHNPYRDNGIKIFSPEGLKISDEWEAKLEMAMASGKNTPQASSLTISPEPELIKDYENFLKRQLKGLSYPIDLSMVVDCSNGASSAIAPEVFKELGFKVIAIHNTPDGKNINLRCGSLHPESLARKVMEEGADIGVAYDGDADRAIWVDEKGRSLNGDHTLFVQAYHMKEKGELKSRKVVATTMSNLGLEQGLQAMGLELIRTKVGDKYVLEKMLELGSNLGGEQSGHTIFLDDCPTGDGILTSLKMLEAMLSRRASLSELTSGFREFPQVLLNVRVREKTDFSRFPEIIEVMDEIKNELAGRGRLDVRYSGTEPLARVMVEAKEKAQVEALARRMAETIAKYLGEGE
jgi:phosphoglucosamine mutase